MSQQNKTMWSGKFGAIALIIGAFLNMIRMIPIYLEVGLNGYPPANLAATVEIAQGGGYYLSHILAIVAAPFWLVGFYSLYKHLRKSSSNRGLTLALAGFSIGQILYVIGVVVHGLVLPELSHEFINASVENQNIMAPLFEFSHHLATGLGGLGFAHILISTGILGIFLRTEFKVLGVIAMGIGLFAVIGYSTGFLALLLFKSFQLTTAFVGAGFIFYFATGISMLRSPKFTD